MATYYIATPANGGDDAHPGTISEPWATLNYAWSQISTGDTVYVRGGTYTYSMLGITTFSGKDGSFGNLIKIWNYTGETPVIDFTDYEVDGTPKVVGLSEEFPEDAHYDMGEGEEEELDDEDEEGHNT